MIKWILEWYSNYRLERLKLKLAAQNKPYEAVMEVTQKFMGVFQTWLDGFKVTDIPKTSVVRPEDEFSEEENRNWEKLHGDLPPGVSKSIRNALGVGAEESLMDVFHHE